MNIISWSSIFSGLPPSLPAPGSYYIRVGIDVNNSSNYMYGDRYHVRSGKSSAKKCLRLIYDDSDCSAKIYSFEEQEYLKASGNKSEFK